MQELGIRLSGVVIAGLGDNGRALLWSMAAGLAAFNLLTGVVG